MFGKSEKKPSPLDSYLPKSKEPSKQEEGKTKEVEKKDVGNPPGKEETFLYKNKWGEEILMREMYLPVSFEVEGSGEKVEQTYKFVFSPGGWELWQSKKEYLLEGLRKVLAIAYHYNMPIWVIFILKEYYGENKEGDHSYSIIIGLDTRENDNCMFVSQEMEEEFRSWQESWLAQRDINLAQELIIAIGFGFYIDFLIRNCV